MSRWEAGPAEIGVDDLAGVHPLGTVGGAACLVVELGCLRCLFPPSRCRWCNWFCLLARPTMLNRLCGNWLSVLGKIFHHNMTVEIVNNIKF